jgi:predicted nucleic acid-binding protein
VDRPVRVLLDVKVLIGNIMAHDRGHVGSANQTLMSMVSRQSWGIADRSQLVISFEMIETLENVLQRRDFPRERIKAYSSAIVDIVKYGPEGLDPYIVLGGEERFALSDVEDAGVLATAFGARADILVTDNLRDFTSKDASSVNTQIIETASSGTRILQAFRYEIGNTDLIIAHPFDVLGWIRAGFDFTPEKLWPLIAASGIEHDA